MIENPAPTCASKKADLRIREALLDSLGVPKGAATVARRPTPEGDLLVVRLTAPGLLLAERRPAKFRGFPVTYKVVRPLKVGRLKRGGGLAPSHGGAARLSNKLL